MTSQVNPNNIDGTYPVAGQDNDSQGFRDNFTNIRNNFTYVKAELEDIQNKAVLKSALNNTTLSNDFAGNVISNPSFTAWRETYNNIGSVSGAVTINFANGNFQKIVMSGSTTLSFSFPSNTTNQLASIKLWINNTNASYTLTLPSSVTLGDPDTIAGLSGTSPPIITFNAAEIANNSDYLFEFFTVDGGATIGIKDLVRNRDIDLSGMQISGNLNLDNISATGNIVTTNGIFWAANGSPFSPIAAAIATSGTVIAAGNIVAGSTANNVSDGDTTVGSFISKGSAGIVGNLNVQGNLWVSSGNIRTTASTANIFNFSGATISMGNATTNIFMGVSTGNVTVGGNIIAGANARAASFVPTGTAIPAYGVYSPSAGTIGFSTNFTPNWLINASGTFLPQTDNTFDIGNGITNPRDVTVSRNVVATGNVKASGNLHTTTGRINSGYFYANVVTNQNLFANVNYNYFIANASPHGTVANLRFTLPSAAEDGREIIFRTLVPITVCFVSNGAETSTTGNTVQWVANTFATAGNVTARFVYNATSMRWMNLGN